MVAGNGRSRGSGISCLKSVNKRGVEKRALKPEQIMQMHSPNDTEIVSASSGNDSNLDEGNDTKNTYEGSLNPTKSEEEETVEEEMSSEEEEEDDDFDEGGEDEGSSDAKDGDNDTDDEDDTGGPKLVGFVDAMSKILAQNVEEGKGPILARRTTIQMKKMREEKAEIKAQKISMKEKKTQDEKGMVIPDLSTHEYDRKLRKIATKGVVALFNAITKHQKGNQQDESNEKVKKLSKDNFLSLLKSQSSTAAGKQINTSKTNVENKAISKSTWSVLDDNYMMGAKLKDWDKEEEKSEEEDDTFENNLEGDMWGDLDGESSEGGSAGEETIMDNSDLYSMKKRSLQPPTSSSTSKKPSKKSRKFK